MDRLDMLIFGASGFTGQYAVGEAARLCAKYNFTWGVAGRDPVKLRAALDKAAKDQDKDTSKIKIVTADVNDYASLVAMCGQAKVLVNCTGPYRLYGEPVVRACIEARTHHVDISGEPEFIERMQLEYSAQARDAGVYIVSACGFDSIPNDLGVVFLEQQFEGTVNSVESYLSTHQPSPPRPFSSIIHSGTWDSMVHGISNWDQLKDLRNKLYPEPLPKLTPKLQPRSLVHSDYNKWCIPFPGADGSIVYRTQRYFYEQHQKRPVQFKAYVKLGHILLVLGVMFLSTVVWLMSRWGPTRNLLLQYPEIFSLGLASRAGPSEETMKSSKFRMTLRGVGWDRGQDEASTTPNKKITVTVSGVNPGYGATVTALLLSAHTILTESNNMPHNGGVLTTGAAFSKTTLIQKLNDNNIVFEVVSKE